MWSQIVVTLFLLVIVTYALQLFVPRSRKGQARTSARWDIAPMLGFFGVLLLALSLLEAFRRALIDAWAWGILLGLILGIAVWVGTQSQPNVPTQKSGSALLATWRFLRTFGVIIIVAVVGTMVVSRIFGSIVEVFISGALGVLIIAIALRLFTGGAPVQERKG